MKAVSQHQPNWSEQDVPKPRSVIWLTPETSDEREILNQLANAFDSCGWTGLDNEMLIIEIPK